MLSFPQTFHSRSGTVSQQQHLSCWRSQLWAPTFSMIGPDMGLFPGPGSWILNTHLWNTLKRVTLSTNLRQGRMSPGHRAVICLWVIRSFFLQILLLHFPHFSKRHVSFSYYFLCIHFLYIRKLTPVFLSYSSHLFSVCSLPLALDGGHPGEPISKPFFPFPGPPQHPHRHRDVPGITDMSTSSRWDLRPWFLLGAKAVPLLSLVMRMIQLHGLQEQTTIK